MRRQAETLDSYSITLHCYDCRSVRLTFVTEPDGRSRVLKNKEENQTVPKKLMKVKYLSRGLAFHLLVASARL